MLTTICQWKPNQITHMEIWDDSFFSVSGFRFEVTFNFKEFCAYMGFYDVKSFLYSLLLWTFQSKGEKKTTSGAQRQFVSWSFFIFCSWLDFIFIIIFLSFFPVEHFLSSYWGLHEKLNKSTILAFLSLLPLTRCCGKLKTSLALKVVIVHFWMFYK